MKVSLWRRFLCLVGLHDWGFHNPKFLGVLDSWMCKNPRCHKVRLKIP